MRQLNINEALVFSIHGIQSYLSCVSKLVPQAGFSKVSSLELGAGFALPPMLVGAVQVAGQPPPFLLASWMPLFLSLRIL